MSFVEVLPVEPTTATTRALALRAHERRERRQRGLLVVGDERARARARAASRTCSTPAFRATKRSPGPTTRESALIAGDRACSAPVTAKLEQPEPERRAGRFDRDHARTGRAAITRRTRTRAAPRGRRRDRRTAKRRRPISWPCSWPLPAITTTSPGARDRNARADRTARGPGRSRRRSPAPWRMSWMIASGSSLRGLSDVTIARRRARAATAPISGRLPRSRSPPAPKTTDQPAARRARAPPGARVERVGRVRVVDDDRERLALVDRLEPARDARASPRRPPRSRRRRRRAAAPAATAPEHVLDVEPPAQRRLEARSRRRRSGCPCGPSSSPSAGSRPRRSSRR